MVAARFEGDISRGSFGKVAGLAQGMNFCVRFAGLEVEALADDLAATGNHAANAGVG